MAAVKRGLKRGLKGRPHRAADARRDDYHRNAAAVLLLRPVGEQVRVPITGNRAKRILHGAINVTSGDVSLLITEEWVNETHQTFLSMIRSHWRGWNIVLFEDRASQHKSPESLDWAEHLGIEVRLLPRATPELNAMDHLWRHTKRETVGSRATQTVAARRSTRVSTSST